MLYTFESRSTGISFEIKAKSEKKAWRKLNAIHPGAEDFFLLCVISPPATTSEPWLRERPFEEVLKHEENQRPYDRDPEEPVAHIARALDELLTAEGEPFEDAISVIQITLTVALSDEARGGMGLAEHSTLKFIQDDIERRLNELKIATQSG
jgi:hypothetical protein